MMELLLVHSNSELQKLYMEPPWYNYIGGFYYEG